MFLPLYKKTIPLRPPNLYPDTNIKSILFFLHRYKYAHRFVQHLCEK